MTLRLTPDTPAAAYEYLRTTLPFKRWKLPHADEVEFHVTRHRDRWADHSMYHRSRDHIIRVSAYNTKTTGDLLQYLGHECVHAYQDGIARTGSRVVVHNTEFKRLAHRVCAVHGWDVTEFVGP